MQQSTCNKIGGWLVSLLYLLRKVIQSKWIHIVSYIFFSCSRYGIRGHLVFVLSVCPSVAKDNNIFHNFWTIRDRVLIWHAYSTLSNDTRVNEFVTLTFNTKTSQFGLYCCRGHLYFTNTFCYIIGTFFGLSSNDRIKIAFELLNKTSYFSYIIHHQQTIPIYPMTPWPWSCLCVYQHIFWMDLNFQTEDLTK